MSEYSKELARQFHCAKQRPVVGGLKSSQPETILDKGFARLRSELLEQLRMQCKELNQEPEIGNILMCDLANGHPQITRTDTGAVLCAEIDAKDRTIVFKCEEPFDFEYVLKVKPTISGTGAWFEGNGASIGDRLDAVARTALSALWEFKRVGD